MGVVLGILVIAVGAGLAAAFVVVSAAIARGESRREAGAALGSGEIGTSILHQIASEGGADAEEAARLVREHTPHRGPVRRPVDVGNWAEAYARRASEADRQELLEAAVRIAVAMHAAIPLRQYNALLELSFGLGFRADALARLRARYRFDYIDYAKASRPRSADRTGGGAPLFDRRHPPADTAALLRVLGLTAPSSRTRVISAYRRLAAQHHPDRFHGAEPAAQEAAARRFIEITEAYERLLGVLRDDPPGR